MTRRLHPMLVGLLLWLLVPLAAVAQPESSPPSTTGPRDLAHPTFSYENFASWLFAVRPEVQHRPVSLVLLWNMTDSVRGAIVDDVDYRGLLTDTWLNELLQPVLTGFLVPWIQHADGAEVQGDRLTMLEFRARRVNPIEVEGWTDRWGGSPSQQMAVLQSFPSPGYTDPALGGTFLDDHLNDALALVGDRYGSDNLLVLMVTDQHRQFGPDPRPPAQAEAFETFRAVRADGASRTMTIYAYWNDFPDEREFLFYDEERAASQAQTRWDRIEQIRVGAAPERFGDNEVPPVIPQEALSVASAGDGRQALASESEFSYEAFARDILRVRPEVAERPISLVFLWNRSDSVNGLGAGYQVLPTVWKEELLGRLLDNFLVHAHEREDGIVAGDRVMMLAFGQQQVEVVVPDQPFTHASRGPLRAAYPQPFIGTPMQLQGVALEQYMDAVLTLVEDLHRDRNLLMLVLHDGIEHGTISGLPQAKDFRTYTARLSDELYRPFTVYFYWNDFPDERSFLYFDEASATVLSETRGERVAAQHRGERPDEFFGDDEVPPVIPQETLTVTFAGDGSGRVWSSPDGIDSAGGHTDAGFDGSANVSFAYADGRLFVVDKYLGTIEALEVFQP